MKIVQPIFVDLNVQPIIFDENVFEKDALQLNISWKAVDLGGKLHIYKLSSVGGCG